MNPRHPSRQTYGLEQKRRRPPLPPMSESRLQPAASPAFDKVLHECSPTYPWKEFPNGLEKRGDLVTWSRTSYADGAAVGRRNPSVACSGLGCTLAGTPFRLEGGGVAGVLPTSPRSRSLRLVREREAGVGGIGCWLRPTPTLRPRC